MRSRADVREAVEIWGEAVPRPFYSALGVGKDSLDVEHVIVGRIRARSP